MKKNLFSIAVIPSIIILAGIAQAGSVTFLDSSADNSHWSFPGYASTNGSIEDEVGTPKIESMDVVFNDATRALETVRVNLHTNPVIQSFDSLFINSDYQPLSGGGFNAGDFDTWDYFVHSGGTENVLNTNGAVPSDGLYEVADSYTYSTNSNHGRTDHPNGLEDNASLAFLEDFSRDHVTGSFEILFDFTTLSTEITLGDSFAFAYSPWCANDVVWGTHGAGDPVPEPTTMVLFGAGLVGLTAFRRTKKK